MKVLDNKLAVGIAVSIPILYTAINLLIKKSKTRTVEKTKVEIEKDNVYKEFGQEILPLMLTPDMVNNGYKDKKYMPFRYPHNQTMSLCKMDMNYWGVIDHSYVEWQNDRRKIFDNFDAEKLKTSPFFKRLEEFNDEFIELMEFVVNHYTNRFPLLFTRNETNPRIIENKLTGELLDMDNDDPLAICVRISMEDFYVVQKNSKGEYMCIGTAVSYGGGGFPISPIVGEPMDTIHKPVPYYESKLKFSMNKWFDRFVDPAERASWHIGWDEGLHCTDIYPKSRELNHEELSKFATTIPFEDYKVRLERQTLMKLPKTKAILFANHPMFVDIANEAKDEPMVPSILLKVMYEAPEDIIKFRHFDCIRDYLKPFLEKLIDYQIDKKLISKEDKVRTISNYPYASWVSDLNNWSLEKGFVNPYLK
ncbi:hypothetical protein CANARDRAFT_218995 [[Candida] arabinofermentans NRRL YB-2248]|uniref:Uncharacterized protein n=1 Tax=[Candida] arabinofermentans NRRL YB-2248 TaxID=983967 RepID=A0A1E4T5L3_9ASCO|nr:hypothetical protein CANARDRAFT_218995 [[Candida] arabinofermentans NRRL YB-2248]